MYSSKAEALCPRMRGLQWESQDLNPGPPAQTLPFSLPISDGLFPPQSLAPKPTFVAISESQSVFLGRDLEPEGCSEQPGLQACSVLQVPGLTEHPQARVLRGDSTAGSLPPGTVPGQRGSISSISPEFRLTERLL